MSLQLDRTLIWKWSLTIEIVFKAGVIDDQLVIELTVGELRGIIRELINQTLERCIVEGVMEGTSSITLRVVGDVRANIKCI